MSGGGRVVDFLVLVVLVVLVFMFLPLLVLVDVVGLPTVPPATATTMFLREDPLLIPPPLLLLCLLRLPGVEKVPFFKVGATRDGFKRVTVVVGNKSRYCWDKLSWTIPLNPPLLRVAWWVLLRLPLAL